MMELIVVQSISQNLSLEIPQDNTIHLTLRLKPFERAVQTAALPMITTAEMGTNTDPIPVVEDLTAQVEAAQENGITCDDVVNVVGIALSVALLVLSLTLMVFSPLFITPTDFSFAFASLALGALGTLGGALSLACFAEEEDRLRNAHSSN